MSEPELPEGWPDAFDEETRDYLYDVANSRVRETTEFGGRQQEKALALLSLSFALIAVGGIFGDLHLARSVLGIVSILAIACAVAVGASGLLLVFPREWATGADVDWLARWEGASRRAMKDAVLDHSVRGFRRNRQLTATRGKLLTGLVVALALQTVFVVLVQVVSALE